MRKNNPMSFVRFIKNKILLANIAFFLVLFSVSVGVRVVNMGAPLGRGHEWITGHVLTTNSIFEKGGIGRYYYSPVWSFDQPAENHFFARQEFKDKNNAYYYISYPPFCFIAPYLFFKITATVPGVTAIRIFGLFIHSTCALLVLLTVYCFARRKMDQNFYLPGFVAAAVYLLAAGNLWFHCNLYFADTLEQLFAIWTVYMLARVFVKQEDKYSKGFLVLLGLVNFLGVYTEWLQVFIAFISCIVFFIFSLRKRKYFLLLAVMATSTLLSLSLTLYQYTRILSFDNLKKVQVEKYKQRSGRTEKSETWANANNRGSFLTMTQNYEKHYSHVLNLTYFAILILLAVWLFSGSRMELLQGRAHVFLPLFILTCACIMHLVVFFNFNVIHDFGTVKGSTIFSLIIGLGMAALLKYTSDFSPLYRYGALVIFLGVTGYYISESVNRYYRNNNSGQVTYFHANFGEAVRKHAKPDEFVFGTFSTPVTEYYAQRKVFQVVNLKDAFRFLKDVKFEKGLFIDADNLETGMIKRVVRLTINGDSTTVDSNFIPKKYTDPITGQ